MIELLLLLARQYYRVVCWILVTILLLCGVVLSSCSGRSASGLRADGGESELPRAVPVTQPGSAPPAAPVLATPAGLLAALPSRQSMALQMLKHGEEFDLLLPRDLVVVDDIKAKFSPTNTGSSLSGAAYCTYRFFIPGYDRNPQIRADWDTLVDPGMIWFGLANWTANRWDWYGGSAEPKLNLQSIDPYLRADGQLFLVVLCAGSATMLLNSVQIGSHPPEVSLNLTPEDAFVPVSIVADAAGLDQDGTIVKYEWDFNGNGIFELDSGTDSSVEQTVMTAGTKNITVRVTDDEGVSSIASETFRAFAQWIHSYGGSDYEGIAAVAYDGQNSIYAAGSTYSFGATGNDILLLKYNLAGQLQWARTWDATNEDLVRQMAISQSGDIVIVGQARGGSLNYQNLLIQVWTSEGELLISRYFDNAAPIYGNTMAMEGTSLYICGWISDFATLALLQYDLVSGLQWVKSWSYTGSTYLSVDDMALRSGPATNVTLTVAGNLHLPITQVSHAIAASFAGTGGVGGELDQTGAWLLDAPDSAGTAVVDMGSLTSDVVVSGTVYNGSEQSAFLSSISSGSGLNSVWALDGIDSFVADILPRPDGGFALAGSSGNSKRDGLYFGFSAAGANDRSEILTDAADLFAIQAELGSLLSSGMLMAGTCSKAAGSAFLPAPGNAPDLTLTWNTTALTPGLAPLITYIDFPGTVKTPTGAVIDSGGGMDDTLLISRPF